MESKELSIEGLVSRAQVEVGMAQDLIERSYHIIARTFGIEPRTAEVMSHMSLAADNISAEDGPYSDTIMECMQEAESVATSDESKMQLIRGYKLCIERCKEPNRAWKCEEDIRQYSLRVGEIKREIKLQKKAFDREIKILRDKVFSVEEV